MARLWQDDDWRAVCAGWVVRRGGVVAYPTEGVFGLGCNPADSAAVGRILALKRRRADKGLVLIAASVEQLRGYVAFPDSGIRDRVIGTWPGAVTWILPAGPKARRWLRGRHATLAVRVTAHPPARALCLRAGPLVSTSANPAGARPARTAAAVRAYFGAGVDFILNAETGGLGGPTPIRDACSGAELRPIQPA